ncbi:hypothetical protein OPQ81_010982 [Rhizoctonia solani]|nr:hypothetical protein OPQ81_010982 [Rhizoctonia solani]
MLNSEDLGGIKGHNLTKKALNKRIENVIKELTADELYNIDNMDIVQCNQDSKLLKGGVLILMNSAKAKDFLSQPDIAEHFAGILGVTLKIIP